MNGSAPNGRLTGSQVSSVMKARPYLSIAGHARSITFQTIQPSRKTEPNAATAVITRSPVSPMRSLRRRREDRSETGGVGTAATNRHPKQACFHLLRLSPACNQNVTFRLPIHDARGGILAPTEPTVHNPKGRESDLNRKTITLIGVLGIAAAMILASVAASAQAKPT